MNFATTVPIIVAEFAAAGIRYALIGGLAMAMRGVQRVTLDVDFILLLEDLGNAHERLLALGYHRAFHSENISHYLATDPALGRVDLLHAFRGPSLGMLERAEMLEFVNGLFLPVIHVEDLIGLKIQAAVNDPSRHRRDWSDIHLLVENASLHAAPLDWDLLADYLALFDLTPKLSNLKLLYGQTH
jgi:hypothetical protein